MQIQVNGKIQKCANNQISLAEFLEQILIEQRGIAVARNEILIPKATWSSVILQDGDRIEIIHAVQGG